MRASYSRVAARRTLGLVAAELTNMAADSGELPRGREGKQQDQIDASKHPCTLAMAAKLQTDEGGPHRSSPTLTSCNKLARHRGCRVKPGMTTLFLGRGGGFGGGGLGSGASFAPGGYGTGGGGDLMGMLGGSGGGQLMSMIPLLMRMANFGGEHSHHRRHRRR